MDSEETTTRLEELFYRIDKQLNILARRQQEFEEVSQRVDELANRQQQLASQGAMQSQVLNQQSPRPVGGFPTFPTAPFGRNGLVQQSSGFRPPNVPPRPPSGSANASSSPFGRKSQSHTTPVDITDTGDEFVVTANLAGFSADDVAIQTSGRVLHIRATRADEDNGETDDQERTYLLRERTPTIARSVPLPHLISDKEVSATMNRGVLTVRLPKADSTESTQQIDIESVADE